MRNGLASGSTVTYDHNSNNNNLVIYSVDHTGVPRTNETIITDISVLETTQVLVQSAKNVLVPPPTVYELAAVFYDPSDATSVSGTTLTDKSVNGINATLSAAGKYDSATSSINIQDQDSIVITNVPFTSSTQSYSFWLKGTGDIQQRTDIISMFNTGTSTSTYRFDYNYNNMNFHSTSASWSPTLQKNVTSELVDHLPGTNQYTGNTTFDAINFSDWNHYCIVFEHSPNPQRSFYFNGVKQVTNSIPSYTHTELTSNQDIKIMSTHHEGISRMEGSMGAFAIFNNALTQEHVTILYNLHQPVYRLLPRTKYWRMAFLATGSTESDLTTSWHATDPTSVGNDPAGNNTGFPWEAPYTDSNGFYTNANELLMRTSLTENMTSRPSPIDSSKIALVDVNKESSTRAWKTSTTADDFNLFSNSVDNYIFVKFLDTRSTEEYKSKVLTVDGQYYARSCAIDIEFVTNETIMEFIWNGHPARAGTLPYIIKIDYSYDGVNYINDVTYMRDSTQTTYPILKEFQNTSDHMVLQRSDGVNWVDAESKSL